MIESNTNALIMKTFEIKTLVKEVEDLSELSDADRKLIDCAKDATARAMADYSHFHVGAAIMLENGEIVTGSNQENAAFPSSLCAERTACYYASSQYPGVAMRKIAIAARNCEGRQCASDVPFQESPISPCGACRQALLEYEHRYGPIEVILYGSRKTYIFDSVSDLLPFCFTSF